jgi:hypothetical protein
MSRLYCTDSAANVDVFGIRPKSVTTKITANRVARLFNIAALSGVTQFRQHHGIVIHSEGNVQWSDIASLELSDFITR